MFTQDEEMLGMDQTCVTCTLVPTKNKSLVLCQPIVLSPVFAIILLRQQKLCSILQHFYTAPEAASATVIPAVLEEYEN